MKPVQVEARNIAMSYGRNAVFKNINLIIEPGEFFALLGPSGSGKSTLLRLIAGFHHPQAGSLLIDGHDMSNVPPWQRNVGMVFQNYALWPHMTVRENVAFGLEERRLARAIIEDKVRAALALVNLTEYAARRPSQLSGGQQQRVALARTLAIEPQVLLLDEPLSNLDAKLRVQMRRELSALQRKLGITTIFVTHDQEEAMTTADRIAVMDEGVIQQIGTPVDLFDHPANRFVASFVGSINLLPAHISTTDGATVVDTPILGRFALPHIPWTGDTEIALRPHTLAIAAEPNSVARVWVAGAVAGSEFVGGTIRYTVRVGGTLLIVDEPHFAGRPTWQPDKPIHVGIDPQQVCVLPLR